MANCSIHGEFKHKHIGLRTMDELWLKENAINIGVLTGQVAIQYKE